MAATIVKIHLINYRIFRDYTIEANSRFNVLAGDNEVGKSSILEAVDLVACGNLRRIEAIGIDKLLNMDAVQAFKGGSRTFDNLPKMIVELYLDGHGSFDFTMNGKNNTCGVTCDGIRLICEPNPDFRPEIEASLKAHLDYFPYDYYSIRLSTFGDYGYSGYSKKRLRTIMIDSSTMNSEYATNDYVKRMYLQYTEADPKERAIHRSKYRQLKDSFRADSLGTLNGRIPTDKHYAFGLRGTSSTEFESTLMIYEDEIGIDNKGTGTQVFIKTDFALERSGENVDVILIEEPENHLSYVNLRKLIQHVSDAKSGQLFITTHNSLISTRLELQNLFLMYENVGDHPTSLHELSRETASYFMKAPVANIIEFATAKRVILLEGPSEYMLFELFYRTVTEHKPEEDGVQVVDIRGLSFKRYLEVAKLIKNRVAVVTDNDGDGKKHCIDKYDDFSADENIKVYFETDDRKKTFEIVLYADNSVLCDKIFGAGALDYMLNNKTEAAFQLLSQEDTINVPHYIQEAIKWIRE